MKSIQMLLCGIATVYAAAGSNDHSGSHCSKKLGDEFDTCDEHPTTTWTYNDNGRNWGTKTNIENNQCGDLTIPQSPIDLKTNWPKKSSLLDRFSKVYTDQLKQKVFWNGHTSQVPVDKAGMDIQTFYSNLAQDTYGSPRRYNGIQFHFHTLSEHTVNGKYMDLEMHTVHLPYDGDREIKKYDKGGFMAAAMGIMFSTKKEDLNRDFEQWEIDIIDEFFDSLKWTASSVEPVVDKIPYGKLMMYVDMQNRYTYRGSVTTPPCATAVYWNVLTTVYPIKQKHVDNFKLQLAKNTSQKPKKLVDTGNYRYILPYIEGPNGSDGQIITNEVGAGGMLIAVIILAIACFMFLAVIIHLRNQLKNSQASPAGGMEMKVQPVAGESVEVK